MVTRTLSFLEVSWRSRLIFVFFDIIIVEGQTELTAIKLRLFYVVINQSTQVATLVFVEFFPVVKRNRPVDILDVGGVPIIFWVTQLQLIRQMNVDMHDLHLKVEDAFHHGSCEQDLALWFLLLLDSPMSDEKAHGHLKLHQTPHRVTDIEEPPNLKFLIEWLIICWVL